MVETRRCRARRLCSHGFRWLLLVGLTAGWAPAWAQSLPAPELLFVWPDRPAPGDEIRLTGQYFTGPGCTVKVKFSPDLEAEPQAASPDTIRVVVPQDARSGKVAVLRSCEVAGGVAVELSNSLPILVIWRELDAVSGMGFYNMLLPGDRSSVLVLEEYGISNTPRTSYLIRTFHNGFRAGLFDTVFGPGKLIFENIAWDPASGRIAAYLYRGWPYYDRVLMMLWSRQILWRCASGEPCAYERTTAWKPQGFAFDGDGNLIVAGYRYVYPYHEFDLWRVRPGDPLVMDPSHPSALLPQPEILPGNFHISGNVSMRVAGDGTVGFVQDWSTYVEGHEPVSHEFFRLLPNGQLVAQELPKVCIDDVLDPTTWFIAGDCRGEFYGVATYTFEWDDCWNYDTVWTVYKLSDMSVAAHVPRSPFDFAISGLATDAWGNIFLSIARHSGKPRVIRRVMPDELVGTYCPLWETSQQSGGLTAHEQSTDPCSRCQEDKKKLVVKWVKDPERPNPDDPVNVAWIDSPVELLVNLGESPGFAAYLCKQNERQCDNQVEARWEIQELSVAPGVDMEKAIYPDHPLFLYGDNLTQRVAHSGRLQTVHLGHAKLKVTVPENQGQQVEPLVLDIDVIHPTFLGIDHNQFDSIMGKVAHRFGIPPQVIKAQVHHETVGRFDPESFRYEARTVDKKELWGSSLLKQRDLAPFRFPDGGCLVGADVAPRAMYYTLTMFDDRPWECTPVSPEKGNDPTLFQYVEANDGWVPCSAPWKARNGSEGCPDRPQEAMPGPCGRRDRWWSSREGGLMSYEPCSGRFFCGAEGASECTSSGEAQWILNQGKGWFGQTALASSYGLLHIRYTTAVQLMAWKKDEDPCLRHPYLLFDPETNLNLGVGYLASLVRSESFRNSPSIENREQWVQALKKGVGSYNSGDPKNPNLNYAAAVWAWVPNYPPL